MFVLDDLMLLYSRTCDLCKIPFTLYSSWTSLTSDSRYELLKWEELQLQKRGEPVKRELEWQIVAREIALMNMPYTR